MLSHELLASLQRTLEQDASTQNDTEENHTPSRTDCDAFNESLLQESESLQQQTSSLRWEAEALQQQIESVLQQTHSSLKSFTTKSFIVIFTFLVTIVFAIMSTVDQFYGNNLSSTSTQIAQYSWCADHDELRNTKECQDIRYGRSPRLTACRSSDQRPSKNSEVFAMA
ncbi:hypothetical protein EJ04DRAFT_121299 [Polyplosphaeria fusca]|uniref:Uncharacterized protein n=1 Tax=Polyplosphaeria fusca TaxID=682080 RepID=A0A9P4QN34_9PLEO|nr:hypothetical protein EJ04DRAFT_121299 [Polyplosphaeria fusca]